MGVKKKIKNLLKWSTTLPFFSGYPHALSVCPCSNCRQPVSTQKGIYGKATFHNPGDLRTVTTNFSAFPHSPVPEIHWRKMDGHLPPNHDLRMSGSQLHLYNIQVKDSGVYKCEAINSKGKDFHSARVSVEGRGMLRCRFTCFSASSKIKF